jgi:hypothetical protein
MAEIHTTIKRATGTASLTISYVTDIEGNFAYFQRFVEASPAVSFDSPGSPDNGGLVLHDGYGLVFGGDLYDKGPHDIRLTKMFCDLKDAHPDRVWLLMGNRDINKLRLISELCTPGELNRLHDGNDLNSNIC